MLAILKTFERQGDIEEERKGRVDECRGKRPRKEGFGSPKPRLGFASSAPHFPHTFGDCCNLRPSYSCLRPPKHAHSAASILTDAASPKDEIYSEDRLVFFRPRRLFGSPAHHGAHGRLSARPHGSSARARTTCAGRRQRRRRPASGRWADSGD
jgi:hypothetical protein